MKSVLWRVAKPLSYKQDARCRKVKCSITSMSSSKMHLKGHYDGKKYIAVENIQVTAEGELVTHFAIGTIRVLYNHHLFTEPGF